KYPGGNHHVRCSVENRDFIRDRRHVTLSKGNQAPRPDSHLLARRGLPKQLAIERAGFHIQLPTVIAYIGDIETKGLVIHKQLNDFAICHVQNGLTRGGKSKGLLAVDNRPGLIKSVHEGAVLDAWASLLRISAHAKVPIAQCEDGFHLCNKFRSKASLDHAPLVGWIVLTWWFQTLVMKHR